MVSICFSKFNTKFEEKKSIVPTKKKSENHDMKFMRNKHKLKKENTL